MALNLKKVENLLVQEKTESSLASILLEYAIIKQKLENSDNQSWYFKKGVDSYRKSLLSLTNDYEKIRELFNETSIDFFIDEINKNNAYISNFNKDALNAVVYMSFGMLRSRNKFYNELIRLKSKTDLLMPMEYYLQNPEAFLEIID
ncbi:hypothetical protein [Aequorivita capsosiphonis]|uniref:hypothetical protein n=1 Tax=Aequorivita capsosiphonis TaxID=487317 RepID=UPI000423CEF8|nr:hypothetical protein [Aequorivita capsosiphonis]